jgi:hypothetical protein
MLGRRDAIIGQVDKVPGLTAHISGTRTNEYSKETGQ